MSILSNREKFMLSFVETTKDQAAGILRRNVKLMRSLLILEIADYHDQIRIEDGCPHCSGIFNCSNGCSCSWKSAQAEIPLLRYQSNSFSCVNHFSFGGTMYQVNGPQGALYHLCYSADYALIRKSIGGRDNFKEIRNYILGHIQWADAVLKDEIDSWKNLDFPDKENMMCEIAAGKMNFGKFLSHFAADFEDTSSNKYIFSRNINHNLDRMGLSSEEY